ncbi:glycosyltransferase family 4 protein [Lacrimispora sp.]|uniref:glycosyltransferase family 4 protein n=1 Tax=Lacrimispora sp. TaxID=2719234 RepID=UPI0032E39E02
MKIAMIGHKRIPGREGGVEVVVEELAKRMVKKGHTVTVYNRRKKGLIMPQNYGGIRLIEVPTIQKKNLDAVIYSFLASIRAVFGNYNVIHYHAIGPSFFLIIPHIFKQKTIVTVHGLNYKTPKWKGFGAWFIKQGERIVAKYADEIIVLSSEQKAYFLEKYNRETIYIPNGTEVFEKEDPELITEKFGLVKKNYILFLSRVVPGKGLEYLLDAYKKIDSDLKLVIAGSSEYVNDFYKMITKKASEDDRVMLIGFVDGKILRELYSNAKLFVFPSEAEGMPICLLEALSYDCPSIVSNIPENMEVGSLFVRSFQSKDVHDLEKQIRNCLNNDNFFKVGSREYIKKNYSWDTIVDRTLNCYKEI